MLGGGMGLAVIKLVFVLVLAFLFLRTLYIYIIHRLGEEHPLLSLLQLKYVGFFFFLTVFFMGLYKTFYGLPVPLLWLKLMKVFALLSGLYTVLLLLDRIFYLWERDWTMNEDLKGKVAAVLATQHTVNSLLFVFVLLLVVDILFYDLTLLKDKIILLLGTTPVFKGLFVFVIYLLLAKAILYVCKTYVADTLKRKSFGLYDLLLDRTEYHLSWLVVIYGLKISLRYVFPSNGVVDPVVDSLLILIFVHLLIVVFDALLEFLEDHWSKKTQSQFDDEAFLIFHNLAKILIIVIGGLFILRRWGIQIRSLLLSLGVIGVVVGFALKDSLDNLMGGISLILDRSFKTGDMIKLADGEIGSVVHVGLRTTRLKTLDNELIIVPNGKLATTEITNYAKPNNIIRLVVPVSVAYGSDVPKVKRVLKSCVKGIDDIRYEDLTKSRFVKMSDFSLNFELIFYIANYVNRFEARNMVLTNIVKKFAENAITIPYPTRTLYMNELKKGKNKTANVQKKVSKKKSSAKKAIRKTKGRTKQKK
jgi:MscS family membrane protein